MTLDQWITTPVGADMYIYTVERSNWKRPAVNTAEGVGSFSESATGSGYVSLQTWPIRHSVSDFALHGHKMAVGPPNIASVFQVGRKKVAKIKVQHLYCKVFREIISVLIVSHV